MSSASVTPSTNSRDCERPFGLLDAVDVRDVAMVQRGQDLRFAFEADDAIAILRAPLGQRFQGDIALKARVATRALELHPEFALALWVSVVSQCRLGRFKPAIETAEGLVSLSNRAPIFVGLLGHSYGAANRRTEALACIEELRVRRSHEYVVPTADLLVWAALRDLNRCYDALTACIEDGVNGAVIVCWVAAFLTDFLGDDRFAALLTRLQLQRGVA